MNEKLMPEILELYLTVHNFGFFLPDLSTDETMYILGKYHHEYSLQLRMNTHDQTVVNRFITRCMRTMSCTKFVLNM